MIVPEEGSETSWRHWTHCFETSRCPRMVVTRTTSSKGSDQNGQFSFSQKNVLLGEGDDGFARIVKIGRGGQWLWIPFRQINLIPLTKTLFIFDDCMYHSLVYVDDLLDLY